MVVNKKKQRMNYGLMALLGLMGVLALGTMGARATGNSTAPFVDIPTQMGIALGISATNAGFLLSCGILASIALTLAMLGGKRLSLIATAAPLVATMGFLVAVNWLPIWVIIVIAVLVAYLLGSSIRTTLTGG